MTYRKAGPEAESDPRHAGQDVDPKLPLPRAGAPGSPLRREPTSFGKSNRCGIRNCSMIPRECHHQRMLARTTFHPSSDALYFREERWLPPDSVLQTRDRYILWRASKIG